jgi:hypothetical protein
MTRTARTKAFDQPLAVSVVDDEILVRSGHAPIEIVLTVASARDTAWRLLIAADDADQAGRLKRD